MTNWFKRASYSLCLLPLIIFNALPAHADIKAINNDIQRLEAAFKKLSTDFYSHKSSYTGKSHQKISDIDQLLSKAKQLTDSNQSISAIQLIHYNIETIENNLDTKAVFEIIELLLAQNDWNLAHSLFQSIKNEGDKSLLATVQFIFAKYHAQRDEWQQVNKLLSGIFTELSEDNASYAYLLNGTALQHLKKHREAIGSYDKLQKNSKYYSYAQLNTAIANIRQGWWTDAQIKIKQQIDYSKKSNKDELTNRLYLVLGYALLQREYFRDARDAFRHIGLTSRYTNRALLGIGLTATSQGDYIGGLNALSILKDKKTFDLSVEESYLIVPYVYEKLQQELTVTSSYTEAMQYYQARIKTLKSISPEHVNFNSMSYNENTSEIVIQDNSFDYGSLFPVAFLNNFKLLEELRKSTKNKSLKTKTIRLLASYNNTYKDIISTLVNERVKFLKSYLNQSRYGLARLYDNTNEASN